VRWAGSLGILPSIDIEGEMTQRYALTSVLPW
jgi:hypothetical protein